MDLRCEFRILVRPEDPLFHGASLQDAMFPFRPEQTSVGRGHGGELQPLWFCDEIRPGTVIENEVGDFRESFVDRSEDCRGEKGACCWLCAKRCWPFLGS